MDVYYGNENVVQLKKIAQTQQIAVQSRLEHKQFNINRLLLNSQCGTVYFATKLKILS